MSTRILASLFLPAALVLAQAPSWSGFEARIQQVMKDWKVPGAAIAIVKDGKPVLVKGFGVRTLGAQDGVDDRTQFGIASLSKAFTAAAIGILVDEGKLKLDDPVIKHLPDFQLHDPYVTRELTVRDLLCHRGGLGLGAGDLLLWGSTYSRDEVLPRLRHLKPATSFRSRYAYQNNMFVVAGQVVKAVSGQPWEAFVTERILKPLGMEGANTSIRQQAGVTNLATPHSPLSGTLKPIPYRNLDVAGPAASINASARAMVPWMTMLLQKGQLGDTRILSERALATMWTPQTLLNPMLNPPPELKPNVTHFQAYGLGWDLRDFRDHRMVSHTGGLDGMTCMLGLLPDQKIGVLVLTNSESLAWRVLVHEAFDRALGEPFFDWSAGFLKVQERADKQVADTLAKQEAARARGTHPSLPLERYAHTFEDAWYGRSQIQVRDGKLELRLLKSPTFVGSLSHWHHNTFKVDLADPAAPPALLTFQLGHQGKVEGFQMVPFSPAADFSYDYADLDFKVVD